MLQAAFPSQLGSVNWLDAWKEANRIKPSLIRVDADEVTYHFHIAIRFMIERDLIEKKLAVQDVPTRWNDLYKQYLQIDVPDDLHGALQDIHWSQGLIGYFPTYSLGSFLSVQLYTTLSSHHVTLRDDIRRGNFDKINSWLAKEIHQHGKVFTSDEIALRLTGKGLGSEDFLRYIKGKFEL
jgi:carboxypeptidase Taq